MNPQSGSPARSRITAVPPPEPLWSTEDTAAYLGVPVATLYHWRHKGSGPRSFRVGKWVRYDPADIRQWLDEQAA